ncbi:unnamed protein product [Chrysoparadoxa australica]
MLREQLIKSYHKACRPVQVPSGTLASLLFTCRLRRSKSDGDHASSSIQEHHQSLIAEYLSTKESAGQPGDEAISSLPPRLLLPSLSMGDAGPDESATTRSLPPLSLAPSSKAGYVLPQPAPLPSLSSTQSHNGALTQQALSGPSHGPGPGPAKTPTPPISPSPERGQVESPLTERTSSSTGSDRDGEGRVRRRSSTSRVAALS